MRHTLRDAQVWAEVDDAGRLVADPGGRVTVVYKRDPAAKTYKAGARNLAPIAGAGIEADLGGGAPAGAPAPAAKRTTRASSGAAAAPAAAANVGRATLGDRAPDGTVHVWTDGACTGNPGPAGLGVVVIDGASRKEHGEYLGAGTNNIAELTAILRGLDLVKDPTRPVRVYTDSQYAIGVLSLGWKAKANVELIQEIKERLRAFTDVRFVKVPGHAGVPENERCDALARGAITSAGRRR
jgi:ribonuclease HI